MTVNSKRKFMTAEEALEQYFRMITQISILLYNILLPINQYSGSIAISMIAKTMNDIGISHGFFIRSLGHCINP